METSVIEKQMYNTVWMLLLSFALGFCLGLTEDLVREGWAFWKNPSCDSSIADKGVVPESSQDLRQAQTVSLVFENSLLEEQLFVTF